MAPLLHGKVVMGRHSSILPYRVKHDLLIFGVLVQNPFEKIRKMSRNNIFQSLMQKIALRECLRRKKYRKQILLHLPRQIFGDALVSFCCIGVQFDTWLVTCIAFWVQFYKRHFISTVRCSIPTTTQRFPSNPIHPIHPLRAPRCYFRLWCVICQCLWLMCVCTNQGWIRREIISHQK